MKILKSKIAVISLIVAVVLTAISLGYSRYLHPVQCIGEECKIVPERVPGDFGSMLSSCPNQECVSTVARHGYPLVIYSEYISDGLNCGDIVDSSGLKYQIGFYKHSKSYICVDRGKPKAIGLLGDIVFYYSITYLILISANLLVKNIKRNKKS